jgi:hypothetical protein
MLEEMLPIRVYVCDSYSQMEGCILDNCAEKYPNLPLMYNFPKSSTMEQCVIFESSFTLEVECHRKGT